MSEFFAMGGYGAYVWTAYVTFLVAILAIGLGPWLAHRKVTERVRRHARRRETS